MTDGTSEKFRLFFERATETGEVWWKQLQGSMQSMTDEEVEALADQAAEFYSGAPGDPIRHLIAEVTADEYARRFNEQDNLPSSNVVTFPGRHAKPVMAAKTAETAIGASMAATEFMVEAEELTTAFIADVEGKLIALDPDVLEVVEQISADFCAAEVCTLDQAILSDVIDAEVARRKALDRLLEDGEVWPDGDGAA